MGRRRRRTHLYVGADLLGEPYCRDIRAQIRPTGYRSDYDRYGGDGSGRHRSYFLYAYRIFEIGRHVDALYLYFFDNGLVLRNRKRRKKPV